MINPILTVHVSTALLSIAGFIFRGVLHLKGSALVNRKWFKVVPHIIDTVLIISAIILFYRSGLDLLTTPWLVAKITALIFYIALGLIAFRFAKSRETRLFAWCGAIMVFAYILMVAVTKNPLLWL